MNEEVQKQLASQAAKIDAIYASVERTRKYLFWMMIASIVFVVLPAIGLVFAIPSFLSSYNSLGF